MDKLSRCEDEAHVQRRDALLREVRSRMRRAKKGERFTAKLLADLLTECGYPMDWRNLQNRISMK